MLPQGPTCRNDFVSTTFSLEKARGFAGGETEEDSVMKTLRDLDVALRGRGILPSDEVEPAKDKNKTTPVDLAVEAYGDYDKFNDFQEWFLVWSAC